MKEAEFSKGYWIVHIKVTDPDIYRCYAHAAPAIVSQLGGKYTVDAGRAESVEGDVSLDRHVVIEFPNYQAAMSAFRSDAYQSVVQLRQASSECTFTIAEGT